MARKLPPANEDAPFEARIIPFGRGFRQLRSTPVSARVRGRVIRPIDVLILLPLIIPLVAAILLGLLGWFVAWLVTVTTLVAAIVFRDLMRRLVTSHPPRS
jgi:hypothetical protein